MLQVIDGKPLADAPAAAAPEVFVHNSQGSQQSDDSADDAGSSIVESAAAQIHARVEVRYNAAVRGLMLCNSMGTACNLHGQSLDGMHGHRCPNIGCKMSC